MNGLWVDSDMDHEKKYMVQLDNDGTGYRLYKGFFIIIQESWGY